MACDVAIIAGDLTTGPVSRHARALQALSAFGGLKLFVPGNHDLWVPPGQDSLHRLEQELPAVCAEAGFHALDSEPATLDGAGPVSAVATRLRELEEKLADPTLGDIRLAQSIPAATIGPVCTLSVLMLIGRILASGAMPVIPEPSFLPAMMPARCVPWP